MRLMVIALVLVVLSVLALWWAQNNHVVSPATCFNGPTGTICSSVTTVKAKR